MTVPWKMRARQLPGLRVHLAERDQLRRDRQWLLAERYATQAALARVRDERDRLAEQVFGGANTESPPIESHLFIVTYGRSGSTLLQGVLNSIPGYLIRGENRQVTLRLLQFHFAALADQATLRAHLSVGAFEHVAASWKLGAAIPDPLSTMPLSSDPTRPWFGIDGYDEVDAFQAFRTMLYTTLIRPAADTRVCGFKEIRWPVEHLGTYLRFMQSIFPNTRFVINTRDLAAVHRSQSALDWSEADLAAREQSMQDALAEFGSSAFHVCYDDWSKASAALRPLFDWLGESFDQDAVEAVLKTPHSY